MAVITEAWQLANDTWALYTENANIVEVAKAKNLRLMAEYYRNGSLFALQFIGPAEVVKDLASKEFPEKPIRERTPKLKPKFKCERCGREFTANSNRQKVCLSCRKEARKEAIRKCVQRYRRKAKAGGM